MVASRFITNGVVGFGILAVLGAACVVPVLADEVQAPPATPTPVPTAVPASAIPTLKSTPIPIEGVTTGNAVASATPSVPRTAEDIAPSDNSGSPLADAREREAQNVEPLSLVEAITLTLRNNPQREAAIAALQAANARAGISKANGGPTVSLSGSATNNRYYGGGGATQVGGGTGTGTGGTGSTFVFNQPQNSQSVTLSASVPIYNGGGTKGDKLAKQAAARSEAANTLNVEQQLVQSTITAYLDVLRNDQLLEVAQNNLNVSREQRRVAGERYRVGSGARLDVLSANTELASARQNVIQASNTLAQSKTTLNVLLGRVPETPVRLMEVEALTPQIPLTTAANADNPNAVNATASTTNVSAQLRDIAAGANPTLASNRALIEQALANIDVAKAAKKPKVSFSLSNALSNPVQAAGRFLLSLGLSASQTLFDSKKATWQITEARALADQAKANLRTQELSVASNIDTQLLSLESAQEQLNTANEAVVEARDALVAAQAGYVAGARTRLEVINAQAALLSTQTDAANARFDVANAQAQLSATVGVLTTEGQQAYGQALNAQEQEELARIQTYHVKEDDKKKSKKSKTTQPASPKH